MAKPAGKKTASPAKAKPHKTRTAADLERPSAA